MLPKEEKLDPRVKRTRQLLEESFMALLEEKSFHSITVQDIADRATVNRATFYAHFEDKFALFDHVIHETFKKTLKSKLTDSCKFSLDNLKLLILAVCEYLAHLNGHCTAADKEFRPFIEMQVQKQLYEFILRWVISLEPGEEPTTPEITASVMSWAIFGIGVRWSQNGMPQTEEEMANQVLTLIDGGMSRAFLRDNSVLAIAQ